MAMNDVWMLELRKYEWQLEEDLSIFVKAEDCSEVLRILEAKGWKCVKRIYGLTTPEAATVMFDASDPRC